MCIFKPPESRATTNRKEKIFSDNESDSSKVLLSTSFSAGFFVGDGAENDKNRNFAAVSYSTTAFLNEYSRKKRFILLSFKIQTPPVFYTSLLSESIYRVFQYVYIESGREILQEKRLR